MAISLLKIGNAYVDPDRKEFLIDTADDYKTLPVTIYDYLDLNAYKNGALQ